ncbi:MAG: holliday junction DNA helicase RuvA [Bacillota bacterium]|nr:MAG: holliday junction DNA helicase RuvA [Bacillota bacterium]
MYSYISGILRSKTSTVAVVENQGIGYRINSSVRALNSVDLNDKVIFYTHLYVREDEISLYGFPEAEGVALFELLLSVSGIGPKAALNICSAGGASEIYGAIVSKDIGWLTKVPGVGRKTAERLVLELREKIARDLHLGVSIPAAGLVSMAPQQSVEGQVWQALLGLGYQEHEVGQAIRPALALFGAQAKVEEVLKAVLKTLAQGR